MFADLVALVPPPAVPVPLVIDHDPFIHPDGLPGDFVAMVAAYGHGEFDDEISLVEPFPAQERIEDWSEIDWTGVVVWALGGSGQWLCWRTTGPPDEWPVAVAWPRGDGIVDVDASGASGLLVQWLRGETDAVGHSNSVAARIPSWFSQPTPDHIYVDVRLGDPGDEFDGRLALFLDAIGRFAPRGDDRGPGGSQVSVETEAGWRLMYEDRPGGTNFVRLRYPPPDEAAARDLIQRLCTALGTEVRRAVHHDGRPW